MQDDILEVLSEIIKVASNRHTIEALDHIVEAHRKLHELRNTIEQYDGTGCREKAFIEAYNRFRSKGGI